MYKLGAAVVLSAAALLASMSGAKAQFFDYSIAFENGAGTPVTTVLSTDGTASLLITNDSVLTGIFAGSTGTDAEMFNFDTTSTSNTISPTIGVFNFPYKIAYTIQPSDINGVPVAGTSPETQIFTGTLGGNITENVNNLTNTYNNVVNTSNGPAELFDYSFPSASEQFEARALVSAFNPGGPPGPTNGLGAAGSHVLGNIALAGVPEPGTVAMLFGMGTPLAMIARRRRRSARKA